MKKLFIKPASLLIISLSILFCTQSAMANQCSPNAKSGTCSHQTGKNKSGCEGIWEKDKVWEVNGAPSYVYTHCTWDAVWKTCNRNGDDCQTPNKLP